MDAIRFSQVSLPELAKKSSGAGAPSGGFGKLLKDGLEKMQDLRADADEHARKVMVGEPVELHRVVLAGERAALAFELTMSIRNKAIEAYQEVMRMQV